MKTHRFVIWRALTPRRSRLASRTVMHIHPVTSFQALPSLQEIIAMWTLDDANLVRYNWLIWVNPSAIWGIFTSFICRANHSVLKLLQQGVLQFFNEITLHQWSILKFR